MSLCRETKSDGSPCTARARKGELYCTFHLRQHQKRQQKAITSTTELLGISGGEALTFQKFHEVAKPFELYQELAYLRTLLTSYRKSIEMNLDTRRKELLEELSTSVYNSFIDGGMKEAVAEKIMEVLHPIYTSILDHYYGPAEPLQPEAFNQLADMIERISRVAERAKKIQDGITLNVQLPSVGPILVNFVRDVVFTVITSPQQRKEIVEAVRRMNLLGVAPTNSLPAGEIIDVEPE